MKHLLGMLAIPPVLINLETRFHSNFLTADRAKSALLAEHFRQYLSAFQTVAHFLRVALFEIFPVIRVKGIGLVPNFDEADNIRICSVDQPDI